MSNGLSDAETEEALNQNTGPCDYCGDTTVFFCDGCFDPRLCNHCEAYMSLCVICSKLRECRERARYVRFLDFLWLEFPGVVYVSKVDESFFPIVPAARPYPTRVLTDDASPNGTRDAASANKYNVALAKALISRAPTFVLYSIIESSVNGNDVAKARWLAYRNQYPLQRP